jgi:hypothetical protein
VSEPAPLLGREGIEEAFRRLGDRLAKRGVVADIYVFGGGKSSRKRSRQPASGSCSRTFSARTTEWLAHTLRSSLHSVTRLGRVHAHLI